MSIYDVDIKVFVDDPASNPPEFRLECNDLPTIPNTKHDFYFENRKGCADGFLVRFILQGDAHRYRFPDDALEAIYSAKGQGCPREPGHWFQFTPVETKSGNKILVVRNRNHKDHKSHFGYTLRLTKSPHVDTLPGEFLELDPGGQNGNGHGRKLSLALASVAVGAGVVSALVTTAALMSFGLIG